MVDFVAEQLLHGIDEAVGASDSAVKVFARFVPKNEFGGAPFAILQVIGVLLKRRICFGGLAEDVSLFLIKQGPNDQVAVALKLLHLRIGENLACHNRKTL